MGQEEIVNAILADAEEDARKIVAQAEEAAAAGERSGETDRGNAGADGYARQGDRRRKSGDGSA